MEEASWVMSSLVINYSFVLAFQILDINEYIVPSALKNLLVINCNSVFLFNLT